jgi:hypothetical protein
MSIILPGRRILGAGFNDEQASRNRSGDAKRGAGGNCGGHGTSLQAVTKANY